MALRSAVEANLPVWRLKTEVVDKACLQFCLCACVGLEVCGALPQTRGRRSSDRKRQRDVAVMTALIALYQKSTMP